MNSRAGYLYNIYVEAAENSHWSNNVVDKRQFEMVRCLTKFPLQLAIGRVLISYFSAKRQMKLDTELWSGRRDVTLSFVSLINN